MLEASVDDSGLENLKCIIMEIMTIKKWMSRNVEYQLLSVFYKIVENELHGKSSAGIENICWKMACE